MVVRVAVLICGAMYMVVGAGAYMVFGSNIKADVLASFGRENLERLLGGTGSVVVATIVKLLYVASLMVTYPLINWALRVNAFELAWNTTPDPGERRACRSGGVSARWVRAVPASACPAPLQGPRCGTR